MGGSLVIWYDVINLSYLHNMREFWHNFHNILRPSKLINHFALIFSKLQGQRVGSLANKQSEKIKKAIT